VIVVSNLLKVIAAFVAGVVVALGGALVYVRTSEMLHPPPVVQPVSANDQLTQTPAQLPTPPPAAAEEPAPAPPAKSTPAKHTGDNTPAPKPAAKHAPVPVKVRDSAPAVRATKPVPHNEPIQIAQNTQPSPAPMNPAPASAGGDSNQLTLPQPPPPGYSDPQSSTPESAPAPTPAPRTPHVVTLPAGTTLNIRLGETLSTDHNYTGDTFRGTLDTPIIMNGFIIADHGSRVLGRIVNAQKAGHIEGAADLNLTLTEKNTTVAQRAAIKTTPNDRKGPRGSNPRRKNRRWSGAGRHYWRYCGRR
jgi:outer membrane biosynthesis protein TonB